MTMKLSLPKSSGIVAFFGFLAAFFAGCSTSLTKYDLQEYPKTPMESCRGVAHIDATVTPDGEPSSWNIGATLIPFWPALPVSETWHYRMEARIFCHGTLTFKVEFEESEHVKAFWYGRMRADLVNDASQEMHRKLLERLKFETSLSRSTDLNLAQDY